MAKNTKKIFGWIFIIISILILILYAALVTIGKNPPLRFNMHNNPTNADKTKFYVFLVLAGLLFLIFMIVGIVLVVKKPKNKQIIREEDEDED